MRFDRIRALREDHDRTQQAMADILHINRRTYSAYENGVNAVPLDILIALARFYHTSTDYLLGLTDETKPYPPAEHPPYLPAEHPPYLPAECKL